MRQFWMLFLPLGALMLALTGHSPGIGQGPNLSGLPSPPRKFPEFDSIVKGGKEYDGLFKLHQVEDKLFAEIKPEQFNMPLLCPISVARGLGAGGMTLNFDNQWVVFFRRLGDRVFLVRRNVRYQARAGVPVAQAVQTTYFDSILMALPIRSIHPIRQSVLISLNDIFFSDFAQLRLGVPDPNRTTWHKVKAFPRNIEVQVAATYSGLGRAGDGVIDSRGITAIVHYGLCQLPEGGYTPRLADDRVGHFLSVVKDFTNDTRPTSFLRYINRWRLERADGSVWKEGARLVPPKKQIVFWVEKSVPHEYRAHVREGILEWNKAFEKIGFRDAIEVRQQENEDFDPEDINYNTFRWITTDRGFAMGPSRANPLTGELMDADIIFDASMVRYYRQAAGLYTGGTAGFSDPEETVSPIRAARLGMGLTNFLDLAQHGTPGIRGGSGTDKLGWDDREKSRISHTEARLRAIQSGICECGPCMKRELNLLALTLAVREQSGADKSGLLSEELIGQAIKEVTMHEVGHTLGLRHNFKASTMHKNEDLHNTAITRKMGLVGSVMDYTPINLAPKGVKQGDFFTNTLGPYDYWAIEYAYRPLTGGTEGEFAELSKIASRCATSNLSYATDEDLFSSSDPYNNTWDLGADPMRFAQDRILLAEELLGKLVEKASAKGEGYQRTRQAFGIALQEYGNAAELMSRFIGGVSMHRDHKGDANERDPLVPVEPDKQRAALRFLQEHLLTDRPFQFSPTVLRKLAADRWVHWGNEQGMFRPVEYPIHERVLSIQRVVLEHCLDGEVMRRIQNNTLKVEKNASQKVLTLAEVFRSLTDGVWKEELKGAKGEGKDLVSSIIRRNLQREYIKELSRLVLTPGTAPPDARSLARMHLREIDRKSQRWLEEKFNLEDTTRAHLEEVRERIQRVLTASLRANE